MWSEHELTAMTPEDGRKWVAERPERFFPAARFPDHGYSAERQLAASLVHEALSCGAESAEASRCGDWWVVRADSDWLPAPLDREAFERLLPCPQAGDNTIRQELLAAVFAADVVTSDRGQPRTIKGADAPDLLAHLANRPHQRAVAFRHLNVDDIRDAS